MPVLKNPRHELFALGIVQGKSGRAAYHAAGYKAKDATADASASVLIRNHKVAERIAELQNRVSERAEVKIVEVVGTLATVLRANMLDYMRIGPDGLPYGTSKGDPHTK